MSTYVYKKAVRYRIPEDKLESFKDGYGCIDVWDKSLTKKYGLGDKFEFDGGLNFDTHEYEYYLDKVGEEIWDEISGDFTHSRLLSEKEVTHHLKEFQKFDPNIKDSDLRAVEYCYYNGVDAPACYDIINDEKDWLF